MALVVVRSWMSRKSAECPRARTSGARRAAAVIAPRILKAPIGWSCSCFRRTGCPARRERNGASVRGVRSATPTSDAAALRTAFGSVLEGRNPTETVMYCGSGVTACHNLLAMAHAGLDGSAHAKYAIERDVSQAPDNKRPSSAERAPTSTAGALAERAQRPGPADAASSDVAIVCGLSNDGQGLDIIRKRGAA